MNKNKIIIMFSLVAIALGLLTGYFIYTYLAPARQTVYVFNGSYSAGEQVTANMLTPIQVDSKIVDAGKKSNVATRFVTPAEYAEITRSGDSLRMDVSNGMPLTLSMLSVVGGSSVEMNMKASSVAVTIDVNNITGITGELKEGSRVNIYSVRDGLVELIQQNMRILSVYRSDGSLTGVSVEVSVPESLQLVYAASYGTIYLGLVDATGYQASEENSGLIYNSTSTIESVKDNMGAQDTEVTENSDISEYPTYQIGENETETAIEAVTEEPAPAETEAVTEAPVPAETELTGGLAELMG